MLAIFIVVLGVGFAVDNIATLFGVQIGFFGRADSFAQRGSINFLVVGVDAFNLADLIMVAQYNFETGELNAIQIPRDTRVETTRWDNKINSAFSLSGIEELKNDVTQITGLEIDRYVIIGLRGFRDIVDAIGGVEIDVPIRMFYTDPYQNLTIDLRPGPQTLNGRQAEGFIRFRKNNDGSGYPDGDLGRLRAQQQFYTAVMDRLVSARGILQLPNLIGIVQDNVRTDISGSEMVRFVSIALRADLYGFNIMKLPGDSGFVGGISYFLHNAEETSRIVAEYLTPTQNAGQADADNHPTVRINRNKNRSIAVEVVDATGVELDDINLGDMVAQLLRDNAFNVQSVRTDDAAEQTMIIDHNARRGSTEILKIMPEIEVRQYDNRDSPYDVTIILGTDFNYWQ